MEKSDRKSAFIVIKSAEGRRTSAHKTLTADRYESDRKQLEAAGIRRIRPATPR